MKSPRYFSAGSRDPNVVYYLYDPDERVPTRAPLSLLPITARSEP